MDDFVKRVVESEESADMAEVMGSAQPGDLEFLEEAALAWWDKPGLDRKAASDLVLRIATAYAMCRDYQRAAHLATTVADSAMEAGDKEMLGPALGTLGVILMDSGLVVEARRVFEKVLDLTQETGDAHARARALHNLGVLEAMEGRDIRAVTWFEGARDLAREREDWDVTRVSGRFLDLAREASAPAPAPARTEESAERQPCPECAGQGLVRKEDYGMVLCPRCKGACRVE